MRSKHRSIGALSALVVLALAVAASAASAEIKYEWKVNGSALASGSSKEIKLKSKSGSLFDLSFHYSGSRVGMTSSEVKFTELPNIGGGKPGKFEGTIEFTKVIMEKPFQGCKIVGGGAQEIPELIRTQRLAGEIVESATGGKGTGKTEILLRPYVGTEWVDIRWNNCPDFGEGAYLIGSLLAEISPQKAEAKVGKLLFGTESSKFGSEYRNAKGEFKKAGLESGSLEWEFAGEPETELVSKEAFGAF